MYRREKTYFHLSDILAGHLGALLGVEFILYFSSPEPYKGRHLSLPQKHFSFEQEKIINLLQVMETSFAEGKPETVKKCALLLVKALKELPACKEIPVKYRRRFFSGLMYNLFVQLGDDLLNRGFAAEALIFYEELLASYPQDIFLLRKAARAYYARGVLFLPQAEKLYRRILEYNPGDLESYEALGHLLDNYPGREEEALTVYREALHYCSTDMEKIRFYLSLLALSPDDYELLLRLGRLYRRQGMLLESRHYLEEAFKRRPDSWTTLELGRVCCLLYDLVRAKEAAAVIRGSKDSFYPAYYLLGLIAEVEEKWAEAGDNYQHIPPDAPLYWAARAGLARTFLHQGRSAEAEELIRSIPAGQRDKLGAEYLDLCETLENSAEKCHFLSWREYLREAEPLYELKKDICKRSMGTAFWRKYEFLEVCGKGPAGSVLLGRERYSGRKVAIKQFDDKLSADPVSIRRLQGLLKTFRSFSTPYIVPVYEDCWHNNHFFYAMEYMEGGSLAELVRLRAPLPLKEVFSIALQVCSALDYLYIRSKAMSHGALKPENILLSADGRVKVGGFDILWVMEGTKVFTADILKNYRQFTGTFLYAAPERFDSRGFWSVRVKNRGRGDSLEAAVQGVDHRADLYSLGVILFELLTGVLPFKEYSLKGVVRFHRSFKAWPSPRVFNPALPVDLEEIILRLLCRNPSDRYATPAELGEAIKKAKLL